MNWKHPLEEVVDLIIALWLFEIVFKPRKGNESRSQAEKAG